MVLLGPQGLTKIHLPAFSLSDSSRSPHLVLQQRSALRSWNVAATSAAWLDSSSPSGQAALGQGPARTLMCSTTGEEPGL